jgi:hypothetical protein
MRQFADAVIRGDEATAQFMLNEKAPLGVKFVFHFFCELHREAPPVRVKFEKRKIFLGFNTDGCVTWRFEAAMQLFCIVDLLVNCRVTSVNELDLHSIDFSCGPGLAFCSNRSDNTLIPDHFFVGYRGYQWLRDAFARNPIPWSARIPKAFWRGSTTGLPSFVRTDLHEVDRHGRPFPVSDWRSLERIALCRYAKANPLLFDAGVTSVVQIEDPACEEELRSQGLFAEFSPPQDLQLYRYNIDIDGNVNSFSGLYFKLLSGSPVLKVESSRGFRQWYYDRLAPFENYVPVKPDLSDLSEKTEWLRDHDDEARRIGEAGRARALSMTFESESARARKSIMELDRSISAGEAASTT